MNRSTIEAHIVNHERQLAALYSQEMTLKEKLKAVRRDIHVCRGQIGGLGVVLEEMDRPEAAPIENGVQEAVDGISEEYRGDDEQSVSD